MIPGDNFARKHLTSWFQLARMKNNYHGGTEHTEKTNEEEGRHLTMIAVADLICRSQAPDSLIVLGVLRVSVVSHFTNG